MARRDERGDPDAAARRSARRTRASARERARRQRDHPGARARALQGRSRPALATPALLRALALPPGARNALRRLLQELVDEGRIDRLGGRYRLRRADGFVEGVFSPPRAGRRAAASPRTADASGR